MTSAAVDTEPSVPARDHGIGVPAVPPRTFAGVSYPVLALLVVVKHRSNLARLLARPAPPAG